MISDVPSHGVSVRSEVTEGSIVTRSGNTPTQIKSSERDFRRIAARTGLNEVWNHVVIAGRSTIFAFYAS